MKKLGLDLGSSSNGWFLREGEEIIKYGSVIFDAGMSKGQSGGYTSPTRERRESRLRRNSIRSTKQRKAIMLEVLSDYGMAPVTKKEVKIWKEYKKGRKNKFPENDNFLKWLACDFTYCSGLKYENPYELRVKALDDKLTKHELGRALYHIAQRRGYKDIGESDEETENQKNRRKESGFQNSLESDKNRTLAEALKTDYLDKSIRARNQYPYRKEYEDELFKVLEKQDFDTSKNDTNKFKDEFVKKTHKSIIWQQPLKINKGSVGKCILEPKRKRCQTSHPIFEISRAWQFINTIKTQNPDNEENESLPQNYRNALFYELFLKKDSNFKFEEVRKFLDKKYGKKKKYNYPIDEKDGKYKTSISGMPFCKSITKIFGDDGLKALNDIENYNIGNAAKVICGYSIYDIWHIVTTFDEDKLEELAVEKFNVANRETKRKGKQITVSPLVDLKNKLSSAYGNLSIHVLRKITPYLKNGFIYNDAVLLANLPEALGDEYDNLKNDVMEILRDSNKLYSIHKDVMNITNKLVEQYKGKVDEWRDGESNDIFAYKNFEYTLDQSDSQEIKEACLTYFGEKSWDNNVNKNNIIDNVGQEYQEFFFDTQRKFRSSKTLQEFFEEKLVENGIKLKTSLYHHSKRENIFGKPITHKKSGLEILPEARVSSIKNPMFNKAMSILRKVVNELILNEYIDKETALIVEVGKELNDNNKRIAIERYQRERRDKREKIKAFLEQFKEQEKPNLNVDESIAKFEMWEEQTFEETEDKDGGKTKNIERNEILKEKWDIKRYELWMEQKGQCMYTGKMIGISTLFSNKIDIEHTIPRSILPDNTLANQTVAYAKYNRVEKGKEHPYYCPNYEKDISNVGTAIKPRLAFWIQERNKWNYLFDSRKRPSGSEDESTKNRRIQEKHYFKMHLDYWTDKINRFTTKEVKASWARRQLTDTQMISKYAREFLSTYFYNVSVQKGEVTAGFRKMLGFQETDEKDRSEHTHHTKDAAVLTYIPVNASRRDKLLKKMYRKDEKSKKQFRYRPYSNFNAQDVLKAIDESTLIVNYKKDNLLQQTFKKVRKNGKIQYQKDEQGNNLTNKPLIARGDTIRASLFADSFLGKIKEVERYPDGQPRRENNDWKYKEGNDEFIYVKREPIENITKSKIKDIIDPNIAELIKSELGKKEILDFQRNKIRHVRVKKKSGKEVKRRLNYRSEKEYKNFYYSESESKPYGVMLFDDKGENKKLIEVHSYQIAEVYKKHKKFNAELFIQKYYQDKTDFKKQLLKVGQRLIVLQDDAEYEKRFDTDFQSNRLYKIVKIEDDRLWLKHHLISKADDDIDQLVKQSKNKLLEKIEKRLDISLVTEDKSIQDNKERKRDFEKRKYSFSSWDDFRMERLEKEIGKTEAKEIKKQLSKYKKQASKIEIEGETPLLKLNTPKSWNFLYERTDFRLNILGHLNFKI